MTDEKRPSYPNGPGRYITGAFGEKFGDGITERMLREQDEAEGRKLHRVYDKKVKPNKGFIKFLNETEVDYANFSYLDATGVDSTHPIVQKMNRLGLLVIPHDEPKEGKFGYLITDSDQDIRKQRDTDKISLHLHSSFYPTSSTKSYKEVEEFQAEYVYAIDKNYLVIRSDDPKNLKVGFVVVKGDGPVWHYIKRGYLEAIWKAPTEKQRQKKIQEQFPEPSTAVEKEIDALVGNIYENKNGHYAGILRHNVPGTGYIVPVPAYKRFRSQIHTDCRYTIDWTYVRDGKSSVDQLFLTAEDVEKLIESRQWLYLAEDEFDPEQYKLNRHRQRQKDAEKFQKKA